MHFADEYPLMKNPPMCNWFIKCVRNQNQKSVLEIKHE